jgi:glycosyltransferase involved in cell wall biosynthesis
LEHVKRLDLLIEAMATLENTHLCAVGEGPDHEKLEALADARGVDSNFYGRVPNTALPEVLCQSEIFVLPSIKEGNPKALMEAMACGRPCIATDAPGSRDLIQNEENGLLVPATPRAIADAIQRLRDDPEWAAKLGAKARIFAEQHFDLADNISREVSLLGSLMKTEVTRS